MLCRRRKSVSESVQLRRSALFQFLCISFCQYLNRIFWVNLRHCWSCKVGCVFPMVVDSILPRVEFGAKDYQENAPNFIIKLVFKSVISSPYRPYNMGHTRWSVGMGPFHMGLYDIEPFHMRSYHMAQIIWNHMMRDHMIWGRITLSYHMNETIWYKNEMTWDSSMEHMTCNHMKWYISYDPYHMAHTIWFISYGPNETLLLLFYYAHELMWLFTIWYMTW